MDLIIKRQNLEDQLREYLNAKQTDMSGKIIGQSLAEKYQVDVTKEVIDTIISYAGIKEEDNAKKLFDRYQQKKTEREKLTDIFGEFSENQLFYSEDFVERKIEPIKWLVDCIIPYPDHSDNKTINIVGAPGVNKTTLVSYLFTCISCNVPIFNDPTFSVHNDEGKSLVYISLEDGCKRLQALVQSQWQSLVKKGIIKQDNKPKIRYILEEQYLQRSSSKQYFMLLPKAFKLWRPILLCVDSALELNGFFGINNNDNSQVTQSLHPFRHLTKKFGCNTLIINHPVKNTQRITEDQSLINGSQSQISASKCIMLLKNTTTPNVLHLSFAKATYMPEQFRQQIFVIRRNEDCTFDLIDIRNSQDDNNLEYYIENLEYAIQLHDKDQIGSWDIVAQRLNDENKRTKRNGTWSGSHLAKEVTAYKNGKYATTPTESFFSSDDKILYSEDSYLLHQGQKIKLSYSLDFMDLKEEVVITSIDDKSFTCMNADEEEYTIPKEDKSFAFAIIEDKK